MKKFVLLASITLLIVSGVALAQQSAVQDRSSTRGMMQRMMSGEEVGNVMSGMGGMTEMMGRMTKMMDQCSAMMGSEETKGDQKGVEKE